jgi:hypothetical protein
MSSPSSIQCFDKHFVSCAFVYPNPMPHPLQHHINAPSIPLPHSCAAPSNMGQLSLPPNPDPDPSAGFETFLVYCADEIDRTSSCERSRSLTQRDSLCVCSLLFSFATKSFLHRGTITRERERTQLLARPDLPILIPRSNTAQQSRAHPHHLQLLILRQYLQSLVPLGQWELLHVLLVLLLYGALVLCAGFAVRLFSTPTVNMRHAVATTPLASGRRCGIIHGRSWTRFLLRIDCTSVEHKGRNLQLLFLTDIFARFIYSQKRPVLRHCISLPTVFSFDSLIHWLMQTLLRYQFRIQSLSMLATFMNEHRAERVIIGVRINSLSLALPYNILEMIDPLCAWKFLLYEVPQFSCTYGRQKQRRCVFCSESRGQRYKGALSSSHLNSCADELEVPRLCRISRLDLQSMKRRGPGGHLGGLKKRACQ